MNGRQYRLSCRKMGGSAMVLGGIISAIGILACSASAIAGGVMCFVSRDLCGHIGKVLPYCFGSALALFGAAMVVWVAAITLLLMSEGEA